jgi:hypothetical protein
MKMPDFVLNQQTANSSDALSGYAHSDVNGKPALSRRYDAVELALRPEEAARLHSVPTRPQRLGKRPEPNIIFIAVRQIDPRETLGWRVEHFMSPDRNIADELGLEMDRFRMVWAEVQKGSVKDKNDFALKVLIAFASFQPDAAALLRGLVLPDKAAAEVDAVTRAHLIPL